MESLIVENTWFVSFGLEHWFWLLYAASSTAFWIFMGKKAKNAAHQQRIGIRMGIVGILVWAYSEVMLLTFGMWSHASGVPVHLCYFLNFLLPYMIATRSFTIFNWTYPIVMAGCLQALFTPDLTNGFPQFLNLKYWMVHIGLVQCALYAIFVYGFRPTFSSIFKCLLFLNVYALFAALVNYCLDTNFLYLREPAKGSLLTALGPWPWYLIWTELVALLLFLVVWLPFARREDVRPRV